MELRKERNGILEYHIAITWREAIILLKIKENRIILVKCYIMSELDSTYHVEVTDACCRLLLPLLAMFIILFVVGSNGLDVKSL